MYLRITRDEAAKFVANKWCDYQYPAMTKDEKVKHIETMKYNVLAVGFNLSTVLLTVAVASAILFAITTAFVWGSIGLFLRFVTEKEINTYAVQKQNVNMAVLHLIGFGDTDNRVLQIFAKCKMKPLKDWEENDVEICDYAFWKNRLPVEYKEKPVK